MDSNPNKDKNTPAVPPKREPFFDTVRRISDYQISTLLHSLIGLPSSISPPQNTGWLDDSDMLAVDGRDELMARSKTVRSGSDSIVDEVRKLRDDEERKGGSGSGGLGPTISGAVTSAGTTGDSSGDSAKKESAMLPDGYFVPSAANMLHRFEELHRELFWPFPAGRSYSASASVSSSASTELDYYKFFEQHYRRPRSGGTAEGKTVVERVSEVRTVKGPDGVTKTKHVEVKRFSDGTEEWKERENTILAYDGGGMERLREIPE